MNKFIFYFLTILFFLTSCQSFKDGLTGAKRNQSDEFLVEKKNPLTLPPEFERLPEPKWNLDEENNKEEDLDIRKLLGKLPKNKTKQSSSTGLNKSLESSILKKINKN
jgi:hypothetical protein